MWNLRHDEFNQGQLQRESDRFESRCAMLFAGSVAMPLDDAGMDAFDVGESMGSKIRSLLGYTAELSSIASHSS